MEVDPDGGLNGLGLAGIASAVPDGARLSPTDGEDQ